MIEFSHLPLPAREEAKKEFKDVMDFIEKNGLFTEKDLSLAKVRKMMKSKKK